MIWEKEKKRIFEQSVLKKDDDDDNETLFFSVNIFQFINGENHYQTRVCRRRRRPPPPGGVLHVESGVVESSVASVRELVRRYGAV